MSDKTKKTKKTKNKKKSVTTNALNIIAIPELGIKGSGDNLKLQTMPNIIGYPEYGIKGSSDGLVIQKMPYYSKEFRNLYKKHQKSISKQKNGGIIEVKTKLGRTKPTKIY